jgi:hypothetical protein
MTTNQPKWKLVGMVGDINPIDHDGGLVYQDQTGVYCPEMEYIEGHDCDREIWKLRRYKNDPDSSYAVNMRITRYWKVYRILLEKCTYINGILSDNKYHPDYEVWFAKHVKDMEEKQREQVIKMLCSEDANERAKGYLEICYITGFHEFDQYCETEYETLFDIKAKYQNKIYIFRRKNKWIKR